MSEQESESEENVLVYEDEDSAPHDESQMSNSGRSEPPKPKILVQRVFHQSEKHTVEQKVNYVIANSKEEITKHVYGGLFRTKYYKYSPDSYCKKHAPDLLEHEDESFVKIGDKFESLECFRLYIDGNAPKWKYYLKCADSHRKDGKDTFLFQCVLAKKRQKGVSAAKGLRKRTNAVPRCECPCRVLLKPVPFDAKDLTVIYVCNHHDHPLSDEYFYKLQHGRRLHPSVKDELMDLLSLEVDREVVKKYFESLTGYSMNAAFFNNLMITMKKKKIERHFSLEKLKIMSKKIEKIKEELGMINEDENIDDDLISYSNIKKDKASQVVEAFNVLKAVSATKKMPVKTRTRQSDVYTPNNKRPKKQLSMEVEPPPSPQDNRSRLETRLQELKHDRETLKSIKHLQDSVRCETERNPWVVQNMEQNRSSIGNKPKRIRNSQKPTPISMPDIDAQATVNENAQHIEGYVENQDIMYENEITVMESTVGPCPETIAECVQVVETNDTSLNENNVSYCIQYDDGEHVTDGTEQQYVLMLDGDENLENLPEVQIQATEFATISITDNNQTDISEVKENVQEDSIQNDDSQVQELEASVNDAEEIHIIDKSCSDAAIGLQENMVYELIQTNDKKIWPSKQFVDNLILNKPLRSEQKDNVSKDGHRKMLKPRSKKSKDELSSKKNRTSYRWEISKNFLKNMFKEDFDELEDDEYYMVVVDKEDNKIDDNESHCKWMEDFEEYTVQSRNSIEKPTTSEYTESIMSDIKHEMENTGNAHEFVTSVSKIKKVELDSDISTTDERVERENEKNELEKAIDRLKHEKVALEIDIRNLIAKKDDLIEDITKAKRMSRRRLYNS